MAGFQKPKCVEVRSYALTFHNHNGVVPRVGHRIYLVANGKVHGCCTIGGVTKYTGVQAFNRDSRLHQVTPKTAKGKPKFVDLKKI